MEEARRVLERLERIERLRQRAAPAAQLLAELRALLDEGKAWAASEGPSAAAAESSLTRLEDALAATGASPTEEVTEQEPTI